MLNIMLSHVSELCLKSDCSIRIYIYIIYIIYIFNTVSVLLEYIKFITSMMSALLE